MADPREENGIITSTSTTTSFVHLILHHRLNWLSEAALCWCIFPLGLQQFNTQAKCTVWAASAGQESILHFDSWDLLQDFTQDTSGAAINMTSRNEHHQNL